MLKLIIQNQMKKFFIYIAAILFAATTAVGQQIHTTTQEINNIVVQNISVLSKMNVKIVQGMENSISFQCSSNKAIENAICKVKASSGSIELKNEDTEITDISVLLTLEEPSEISMISAADYAVVIVDFTFSGDNMFVKAKPYSTIKFMKNCHIFGNITLDADKYSKIEFQKLIAGSAERFTLNADNYATINIKSGSISQTSPISYNVKNNSKVSVLGKNITDINFNNLDTENRNEDFSIENERNIEQRKIEKNSNTKAVRNYTAGLGLSFLTASNNPQSFSQALNQGNTNLAIDGGTRWNFQFYYPIDFTKHLALKIGLGMEFNWFSFEKDITADHTANNDYYLTVMSSGINYSKYEANLYAHYITLPLILDWRQSKHFGINVGIIGSLKMYSAFKTYYEFDKIEFDQYFTGYNNVNPLKADLHLGLSCGVINVYCRYALTPIFKSGKEEVIYPFSIGLTLGL